MHEHSPCVVQVAELLKLKAEYKEKTGEDYAPPGQKPKPAKEAKAKAPAKAAAGEKKEPTALEKRQAAKDAKKREVLANTSAKEKAKDAAKAKAAAPSAVPKPAAVSGSVAATVQARQSPAPAQSVCTGAESWLAAA